jgi:CheY-like chemotaxis protein
LVIEDDAAHRDAIASVLRESGYEVDIAEDGQQGLDRLEADPATIDVVVLDLMMPALDGWSLLKIVRNRPHLARIPVVVISAYYDPMHDVGAVRFIAKPFKVEALLRALDDVVKTPRSSSNPPKSDV